MTNPRSTQDVDPLGVDAQRVMDSDAPGATTYPAPSTGGGVTDHGALTGLADDDHPQYVNEGSATAKGDMIAAVTPGDYQKFAVGPDGTVLEADTAATVGVKWGDKLDPGLALMESDGPALATYPTPAVVHADLAAHDTLGLATQSELDDEYAQRIMESDGPATQTIGTPLNAPDEGYVWMLASP